METAPHSPTSGIACANPDVGPINATRLQLWLAFERLQAGISFVRGDHSLSWRQYGAAAPCPTSGDDEARSTSTS